MESIPFVKYSGTGNDFIIIDDREKSYPEGNTELIRQMCDRHFGIGSDGLMLVRPSESTDFEMIFFNPDASQSLCGNGSRCAVHFAQSLSLAGEKGSFLTTDGVHEYRSVGENRMAISMNDVDMPHRILTHDFVNTGSPHLIVGVPETEKMDILEQGAALRYDGAFAQMNGTNVNFVKQLDGNSIEMRTYERGVEGETLSCGTGVTAAALVSKKGAAGDQSVAVQTKGGLLRVSFYVAEDGFKQIWLEGPVTRIFEGVYYAGE